MGVNGLPCSRCVGAHIKLTRLSVFLDGKRKRRWTLCDACFDDILFEVRPEEDSGITFETR